MDPNPYESPQTPSEQRPRRARPGGRRKPLWGYVVAIVLGAFLGGALLMPLLVDLDDAGGTQMQVGGFLGLVIYVFCFEQTIRRDRR